MVLVSCYNKTYELVFDFGSAATRLSSAALNPIRYSQSKGLGGALVGCQGCKEGFCCQYKAYMCDGKKQTCLDRSNIFDFSCGLEEGRRRPFYLVALFS